MKKIITAITAIILLFAGQVGAQNIQTTAKSKIEPLHISVSTQKTTNLIFPFAVKRATWGNGDIQVQMTKGVENLLQVKAGREYFTQTNLTAVTADGYLYSFLLSYGEEPTALNLMLADKPGDYEPLAIFTSFQDNQTKILNVAEQVAVKKRMLGGKVDRKHEITLDLKGIYIKDDLLYFQLELDNNSNIGYDIEQLRFFIRDKKKPKRTASQEIEKLPSGVGGNITVIRGQSNQTVVFVLPKFTIPDKKELVIQMMEKNGGRHLLLKVGNKLIVGASEF